MISDLLEEAEEVRRASSCIYTHSCFLTVVMPEDIVRVHKQLAQINTHESRCSVASCFVSYDIFVSPPVNREDVYIDNHSED